MQLTVDGERIGRVHPDRPGLPFLSFPFLTSAEDVFSRRIIGWSMRDDLQADLAVDAWGLPSAAAFPEPLTRSGIRFRRAVEEVV
jgi:transposase InsO family protein